MNQHPHVLIPAAGNSSRLGTNKQLVAVDGQPLLRRAVERVLAAGLTEVTVVTGFAEGAARDVLQGLGCRFVHNPYWERGLGSSLATGAAALQALAPAILVALPDQFQVPAAHFARLARQHELAPRNLIASRYQDVLGVPAVFPARLYAELLALSGKPGARGLFESHRAETLVLDCAEAAVDLDTPADLAQITPRAGSHARPGEAPLR